LLCYLLYYSSSGGGIVVVSLVVPVSAGVVAFEGLVEAESVVVAVAFSKF
jgi:hypothetical protein